MASSWRILARSYEVQVRRCQKVQKQQTSKGAHAMASIRPYAKTETVSKSPIGPLLLCPVCNIEMCLFGIESESDNRDLFTFECVACGYLEVRGVQVKASASVIIPINEYFVPITPFLRGQAFDPELVNAMGAAWSKTCDALGLTERTEITLVAEKIIELAERGLRNPTAIHRMALAELKSNSHLTGPLDGTRS